VWKTLRLPTAGAPVILAASGGADSTALLLGMDELIRTGKLSTSLTVAHLDHALRGTSRDDAAWVVELAEQLGYPAVKRRVDVLKRSSQTVDNLEQAARRARYSFLETTAKKRSFGPAICRASRP